MPDWNGSNPVYLREAELERLFLRLSSALAKMLSCEKHPHLWDYKQGSLNLAAPPQRFLQANSERQWLALSADSGQTVSISTDATSSIQTGVAVVGAAQFALLHWDNFGGFITHDLFAFSTGLGVNLYWIEGVYHPDRKEAGPSYFQASPRLPSGQPPRGLSDLVRGDGLWL